MIALRYEACPDNVERMSSYSGRATGKSSAQEVVVRKVDVRSHPNGQDVEQVFGGKLKRQELL